MTVDLSRLLLLLEKFGTLINYYDATNKISGDWTSFISNDFMTTIAAISVTDYKAPVETWYKYGNRFETAMLNQLKKYSQVLFDITFTILDQVRQWDDHAQPTARLRKC